MDRYEEEFKNKTVGLVTREEFKRKRETLDDILRQEYEKDKVKESSRKV